MSKRKIKRRVKKDKNKLPVDLNNLFIKFCARILKEGNIEKVERIIGFMKEMSQEKKLTYEKDFLVRYKKRHGIKN